jgi:hypothetical protein
MVLQGSKCKTVILSSSSGHAHRSTRRWRRRPGGHGRRRFGRREARPRLGTGRGNQGELEGGAHWRGRRRGGRQSRFNRGGLGQAAALASGRRRRRSRGQGRARGSGCLPFIGAGPQVPQAHTPRSMTSGGAALGWQPGRAPMVFGGPGRPSWRGRGRVGSGRRPDPIQ